MSDHEIVVKTGWYLYDSKIRCTLRIVQMDVRPGSGDHEDCDEFRLDQPGIWFRIDLSPAGSLNVWGNCSVGYYDTLEKALGSALRMAPGLSWDP